MPNPGISGCSTSCSPSPRYTKNLRSSRQTLRPVEKARYLWVHNRVWRIFREGYFVVPETPARNSSTALTETGSVRAVGFHTHSGRPQAAVKGEGPLESDCFPEAFGTSQLPERTSPRRPDRRPPIATRGETERQQGNPAAIGRNSAEMPPCHGFNRAAELPPRPALSDSLRRRYIAHRLPRMRRRLQASRARRRRDHAKRR